MAQKDLERAKALHKSAEMLFKEGDMAGVAGLTYQAFESALMAFNKIVKGKDIPSHKYRMKTAKELYSDHFEEVDFLWEMRNIDLYGNRRPGEDEDVGLQKEKLKKSLASVGDIIEKTEELLKKKTGESE
jgi:HEPN domain-containing protein